MNLNNCAQQAVAFTGVDDADMEIFSILVSV